MFTKNYYKFLMRLAITDVISPSQILMIGSASRGDEYKYFKFDTGAGATNTLNTSRYVPTVDVMTYEPSPNTTNFYWTFYKGINYSSLKGAHTTSTNSDKYNIPLAFISFSEDTFGDDITNLLVANEPIPKLSFTSGNNSRAFMLDEDDKYKFSKSFIVTNGNPDAVTIKSVQATFGGKVSKDQKTWYDDYILMWGTNLDEAVTIAPNQSAEIILNFEFDPNSIQVPQ